MFFFNNAYLDYCKYYFQHHYFPLSAGQHELQIVTTSEFFDEYLKAIEKMIESSSGRDTLSVSCATKV